MPLPRKAILLLLDSLPLGELGCYGGFREKTPGFDCLAARGAVFENAFTPLITDAGSAFDEQGPWSAAWHAFVARLRLEDCPADEIVCSTLAELTEASTSDRMAAFLGRAEPGLLAISGPELVPPPVHGHLSVVDEAVATLHAAIETTSGTEVLFVVGALQGASGGGSSEGDEEESGSELPRETDRSVGPDDSVGDSFPRLVARRINVPLLVRPPVPVVPGLRVQALVTTTDIVATLEDWLLPGTRPPSDAEAASSGGFSLLPLVTCEREAVRNEILIRGPGEIALRTSDRYVVVGLNETAAPSDGVPYDNRRSDESSASPGHERQGDDHDDVPAAVAVFRKPEDVWDRLDVGNTMPEERDMLVHLCRKLFAGTSR